MFSRILASLLLTAILAAPTAHAGSIIVGPGTDVSTLDADAVKRIFLGREGQLGGRSITVVFQKGGDLRDQFDSEVLGRPGAQLTAYWSKLVFTGKANAPEELDGDAAVKAFVASTAGAIGYVSDSAVDGGVKKVFDF